MNVLITGGAGSLGSEIVRQLIHKQPDWRIVVYSRDEGKQATMKQELPEGGRAGLRYFIGDICDQERLRMAVRHVDVVYHCAAMKMIDVCETDSQEAERINVEGTKSVIKACLAEDVGRAIYIGTDKAPNPVSVYGLTKALAESLWIHANSYGLTQFVGVRYGNVIGATKSVFQKWRVADQIELTDPVATRFFWTVQEAAAFVRHVMHDHAGTRGEIYIPQMHSYRMSDIAEQYKKPIIVTGFRCPEKTHEVLWTDWENQWVRDQGDHYCLYPMMHSWCEVLEPKGEYVKKPITSETVSNSLPAYLR